MGVRGRQTTWLYGQTATMRVPGYLIPQLHIEARRLEIARLKAEIRELRQKLGEYREIALQEVVSRSQVKRQEKALKAVARRKRR